MDNPEKFTIRVYGIVINRRQEVLVTDEYHFNRRMTKFPGGGMEYGEGTLDCLKREFLEELGQEPVSIRHFYTTDFFQPTALVDPPRQLMSIYYLASLPDSENLLVKEKPFDMQEVNGTQVFRWIPLSSLSADEMTFPIDKVATAKLLEQWAGHQISTP